jgi:enoyl-CoA hydratase/carnithine racemase
MLPIAGGMQRLADRIGRTHAVRMAMFGDSISASEAFRLGFVSHLLPTERQLRQEADALARHIATGPTRAYAAMRAVLKAWSNGGVAAADALMLDLTMDLFSSADATKGFAGTAKAIEENVEPPPLTFEGRWRRFRMPRIRDPAYRQRRRPARPPTSYCERHPHPH